MDSNLENVLLYKDFYAAVRRIQLENYKEIVLGKLAPYIRDLRLHNDGYLITDKQAVEEAHQLFLNGKQSGKIDELNSLVIEGAM